LGCGDGESAEADEQGEERTGGAQCYFSRVLGAFLPCFFLL
jgi:hypothetical protein